jgi:hypothetical protein
MFVPPTTREERRSLDLHTAIAQRLIEDPDRVLEQARRVLGLMTERNPGVSRLLRDWASILERPPSEIVDVLLDPSRRARELRHVTPFAGVLSPAQRTEIYDRFAESEQTIR